MEQRYAITYRAAEARQVMDWIKAAQSGCLVGLRGAGKSNFLRFLLREDVRRRHLGQNLPDFLFVLVDLLSLTERTEWAVYELILDQLVNQLSLESVSQQVTEELALLHQEVVCVRDPLVAKHAVERCVNAFCETPTRHIVLLLDEFDAVFRELAPSLFRCLRAIRDEYKEQVSYIAVTFGHLVGLREDVPEVEHFCRLVGRNVCYLGPYNEVDSWQMVRYLASQRSIEVNEEDTAYLITLGGGHAGLLKAALSLLWGMYQGCSLRELAPIFKDDSAIQAECRKVWESLSEGEQAALCDLVSGAQVAPGVFLRLERRGLVRGSQPASILFSPLFASFVRQHAPFSPIGTVISRSPRIVQIDGRCIEGLTELEFELLFCLYECRGEVCTKDDLIERIYRQRYNRLAGGVSDEALQSLVYRLRAKVEPPRHIVTVRGEGYKFVEPS